ncbi:MAG: 16S rRNA (guanine(966)-N(2))-methyltransferase RsmD [Deltaproteobacteria bacterium]|nr:16S rRNA (guanine(966)-N(2))-methyltransferase RsmD [Deltaproteobacteria bacterium]
MRVIAGTCKGRRLFGPKRTDPIRPAIDKVKGAVFNILYSVEGLHVLDCFAGTGAMGIEALSRGARYVAFIDALPAATALTERNLRHLGLAERAAVHTATVERALKRLAKQDAVFDLIFVDPPYRKDLVRPTLALIAATRLLAPEGRIVIEHDPKEIVDPPATLTLTDQRKYGQTRITIVRKCVSA